jgi:hypothetical protein
MLLIKLRSIFSLSIGKRSVGSGTNSRCRNRRRDENPEIAQPDAEFPPRATFSMIGFQFGSVRGAGGRASSASHFINERDAVQLQQKR